MFYKRIRHIRGHGIHSPFVYNLITRVIEERRRYYSFDDIELIRKQLFFNEGNIIKRKGIPPKHGALLFRLANYFQPKNILQIGATMGLSTLYLTSYASGLNCISLENTPEYIPVSRWTYNKGAKNLIDVREGDYNESLPQALEDIKQPDFIFFDLRDEQTANLWLFNKCMEYIDDDTLMVFEGIRSNRRIREYWKQICLHPQTTIAIDLFSMGILFFNKKLHKHKYTVCF